MLNRPLLVLILGYDFLVQLELPESPANRDCGMFMVGLSLSGSRTDALNGPSTALLPVTTQVGDTPFLIACLRLLCLSVAYFSLLTICWLFSLRTVGCGY